MLIKKENVSQEQLDTAYEYLKKYCSENDLNLVEFIKEEKNIEPASEYIHKQLNFALRLILKPKKIESLIRENLDFITEAAQKRYDEENPVVKKTKKTKK